MRENLEKVLEKSDIGTMRQFESGATRDTDNDKLDFEACLCPLALERYAEYMLACSYLPDGTRRPDDNWQKGINKISYMKSLMRHTHHLWKLHRGYEVMDKKTGTPVDIEDALCAVLFNTFGYLHEHLKHKV
jgi:hypothetical protein